MSAITARFWEKVDIRGPDECWPWLAARSGSGYGAFGFAESMRGAHRIAWQLVRGPIPNGLCVLHKCDNRLCVNPGHLFLGTKGDNAHDMMRKGRANLVGFRYGWGENHFKLKLTKGDVLEIVNLAKTGNLSQEKIAQIYNISQVHVSNILLGKSWSWLTNISR